MGGFAARIFRGRTGLRPVVPVASDRMLILRLDLPPMPASQRRTAVLFAAEPYIAQALEEVQVILGPRLEDDPAARWLAVVLSRDAFADLMAQHPDGRCDLVPDVLLLPRPAADHWTVAERDGRFLVRQPDGTGFCAAEAGFRAVWELSGRPAIDWAPGTPLADLPVSSRTLPNLTWQPEPALAGFNLAGSRVPDWRHPRRLMALAAVLVLGLGVHLALLALETQRVTKAADAAEMLLRQALAKRGIAAGTSVDAAAAAAALKGGGTADSTAFLPLLSAALEALQGQSGLIALQDLTFDKRAAKLTMTLLSSDLGPLQDAATLLTKAGLGATLGASTKAQGQARATVAISGRRAG